MKRSINKYILKQKDLLCKAKPDTDHGRGRKGHKHKTNTKLVSPVMAEQ